MTIANDVVLGFYALTKSHGYDNLGAEPLPQGHGLVPHDFDRYPYLAFSEGGKEERYIGLRMMEDGSVKVKARGADMRLCDKVERLIVENGLKVRMDVDPTPTLVRSEPQMTRGFVPAYGV